MKTLKEGKEYLRANFNKGTNCPCCNQFVKLYKRKLNSIMARTLIRLSHLPFEYNHVKEIVKGISDTGTNDFSKLAYWKLIREMPNNDKARKTSGYWKITAKGREFASGKIDLQKYALIYNGEVQGFSEDLINIKESLGNKFNYSELMNANEYK